MTVDAKSAAALIGHRVARRFLSVQASSTRIATVVYRGPEIAWGWTAAGPPRMHVEPMTPLYRGRCRVWLEDRGTRAFLPVGETVPGLDDLRRWITDHRLAIEKAWLAGMTTKGWLRIDPQGAGVGVVAYPGEANEIRRWVSFLGCPGWLEDDDVAVEGHELVVGGGDSPREQIRMLLPRVIWEGADDGSDANAPTHGNARGVTGVASTPRQLLDERLKTIAALGQRLLTRAQVNPATPAHAITEDLRRIIELAGGGRPSRD